MAVTDVQVLQSNDYGSMNQMLVSALSQGWKPTGGIIVASNPREFYQSMYKGLNIEMDSYQALISNNQALSVRNSTGSISATGTLAVAQNIASGINLPATSALVNNSYSVSIPVTTGILLAVGTATKTVTFTVAGGVPTAISIS